MSNAEDIFSRQNRQEHPRKRAGSVGAVMTDYDTSDQPWETGMGTVTAIAFWTFFAFVVGWFVGSV